MAGEFEFQMLLFFFLIFGGWNTWAFQTGNSNRFWPIAGQQSNLVSKAARGPAVQQRPSDVSTRSTSAEGILF